MKKITLLFTLLCTGALNGMEQASHMADLPKMENRSVIKVSDESKEFLNEYLSLPEDLRKEIWDFIKRDITTERGSAKVIYFQLPIKLQRKIQLLISGDAITFLVASALNNSPSPQVIKGINNNVSIPQLSFFKRAYEATIAGQEFIIDMPKKINEIQENESQEQIDGRIYFSFPDNVREYLRNKLNIRRPAERFIKPEDCRMQ